MGFSIFKKKGDEIDEVEAAAADSAAGMPVSTKNLKRSIREYCTL